jgi:glyoxylase-like metal-dependent hydrolase (beta-lactamase superfamily II)
MISLLSIPFMAPIETGELPQGGVYALKNRRNNVFAIKAGGGLIAIDSGSAPAELSASFSQIGLDMGDVADLFLTHSDSDHISGLGLFPNARIYVSKRELKAPGGDGRIRSVRMGGFPASVTADRLRLLDGGESFEIGGRRIGCIPAPGHSPGSMAYLLDGTVLFSGDALRIKGGKPAIHPFTGDKAAALASIERLSAIGKGRTICTSHYGALDCREAAV